VLDEADEMLDMGFAEDLEAILDATPEERQSALFSATMAPRVAAIAERHLREPVRVTIARQKVAEGEMPRVRQVAYVVPRAHKNAALARVLDMEAPTSAIVFCRTRGEVDELAETLTARGYRAEALHGGLSQEQRDRVMKKFRGGTVELLVATDVAARGLDIEHLSHVVNYDVPSAPEAYVHRIGRTGRAGREGVAITLAEPREHRQLRNIEQATKQRITVETVPSVADLRARRLELTRAQLNEVLMAGALDGYRVVGETLASEFDPMDVVAAAVKLVHEAQGGGEEEEEIPVIAPPSERGAGAPPRRERTRRAGEGPHRTHADRGGRAERGEPTRGRGRRAPAWTPARLYIGAGRNAGVRPADVVGAIANEAGVDASAVGAIEIADRFTLVEVPEEIADHVLRALRGTTIKGRRVPVRRDRERS
jgi:ATP-dependent RNA helicase DeaD